MNDKKMTDEICDLIQIDIDASVAYNQALKNIDDKEIYNVINTFYEDHQRHIKELSAWVRDAGGTPPEIKQDMKGFLIEGFTAIRSMTGTAGALAAMQKNEQLTNRYYAKAHEWKMDEKLKGLVDKNYEDEKRHLKYIEEQLNKHNK